MVLNKIRRTLRVNGVVLLQHPNSGLLLFSPRARINRMLARGNVLEAGGASARHLHTAVGLRPEYLVVARFGDTVIGAT